MFSFPLSSKREYKGDFSQNNTAKESLKTLSCSYSLLSGLIRHFVFWFLICFFLKTKKRIIGHTTSITKPIETKTIQIILRPVIAEYIPEQIIPNPIPRIIGKGNSVYIPQNFFQRYFLSSLFIFSFLLLYFLFFFLFLRKKKIPTGNNRVTTIAANMAKIEFALQ